ncbi:hypothetical protein [Rhizobium freirei]|uniref:hypothetical protein n=1 Tax=Rhizobium freirei TaxID=1353277 RepID=UPI0012F97D60|nr:hypothetical protein [Rhizobium freirei]
MKPIDDGSDRCFLTAEYPALGLLVMAHFFNRLSSLRWFMIDHMLLVILALMIVTVVGVLFVHTRGEPIQNGAELQRSAN